MANKEQREQQRKMWDEWFAGNTLDLMVQRELVDRDGKMVEKAAKRNGYRLLFKRAHYYFRKEA